MLMLVFGGNWEVVDKKVFVIVMEYAPGDKLSVQVIASKQLKWIPVRRKEDSQPNVGGLWFRLKYLDNVLNKIVDLKSNWNMKWNEETVK